MEKKASHPSWCTRLSHPNQCCFSFKKKSTESCFIQRMGEKERSSASWNPISLVKTTKGTNYLYSMWFLPVISNDWYSWKENLVWERKESKIQNLESWLSSLHAFFFLSHSLLFHETPFNISQAGLELGMWLKMALNFWFSCLYLPSPAITARAILHGLWGAWDGTQDAVHARQALYHLSNIVKTYPSLLPSPVCILPPLSPLFFLYFFHILSLPLCSLPKGSVLEPL